MPAVLAASAHRLHILGHPFHVTPKEGIALVVVIAVAVFGPRLLRLLGLL